MNRKSVPECQLDCRVCLFIGWMLNVPATCECISRTDLLRHYYVLPHKYRRCGSNFLPTQSQYTDTGPTSPSTDPITPGAWQGIATGVPFLSHWYDSTPKKSRRKRDSNPGSSALEADALTTRPTRRWTVGINPVMECSCPPNSLNMETLLRIGRNFQIGFSGLCVCCFLFVCCCFVGFGEGGGRGSCVCVCGVCVWWCVCVHSVFLFARSFVCSFVCLLVCSIACYLVFVCLLVSLFDCLFVCLRT